MAKRQKPKEKVEIIGIYLGGHPKLKKAASKTKLKKDSLFTKILKALHIIPPSSIKKKREKTRKRVIERKNRKRKFKEIKAKTKKKEKKLRKLKHRLDKNKILKSEHEDNIKLLIRDDLKKKKKETIANAVLSTKVHDGKVAVMEKKKVYEPEKRDRIRKIERNYDKISKKIDVLENKEKSKTLTSHESAEKKELIHSLRALRREMRLLGKSIDSKMQIPPQAIQQSVQPVHIPETKTKEQEADEIKELMSALRYEYYKRRISEKEYKVRLFEYQTKLRTLGFTVPKEIKSKVKEKKKATAVAKFKAYEQPKEPETSTEHEQPKTLSVEKLKVNKLEIAQPVQIPPQVQQITQVQIQKPKEKLPDNRMELLVAEDEEAQQKSVRIPDSKIGKMIRAKPSEKIDSNKVAELEAHVKDLMKKHKISKLKADDVEAIDKNQIIEDFDKLINLIDLEKHTKELMHDEHRPEHDEKIQMTDLMPALSRDSSKKDKIKAIAKEITKYKIVTDFDTVLQYVKSQGRVSESKLAKELKMDKKRLYATTEVLEHNELIRIEYPPIGAAVIYDINYKKPEKKKKKRS